MAENTLDPGFSADRENRPIGPGPRRRRRPRFSPPPVTLLFQHPPAPPVTLKAGWNRGESGFSHNSMLTLLPILYSVFMRGFIGCDADLEPGTMVTAGDRVMTVIRKLTEAEARESYEATGQPLKVVEGERFYEVDSVVVPVGGNN